MSYDSTGRRSTPLARQLASQIARSGPMSVHDYMHACLWHEQHGYYATRHPLGQAGDFITAPEISQVFGELIGLWSAVVWRDYLGAPSRFVLAELGPGRGTLMRDALRSTAKVPGFQSALRCHLIDASEPLIAAQKATLAASPVSITWGANLAGIDAPAVLIANEFFDAMPVDQWVKTERGWISRCIELAEEGSLRFGTHSQMRIRDDLAAMLPDAPLQAIAESQRPELWLGEASAIGALAKSGPVAVLIIDYGHVTSAMGDTLQAVRNHTYEHPLTSPGEADLSAQVDFAALARTAISAGLAVDGPISQGEFLGRLGVIERAHALMASNPAKAAAIEAGVARLIAPGGMGSRFKVLGLRSPGLGPSPGFQ